MTTIEKEWAERVRAAAAARTPLCLRGGGSKGFYGGPLAGEPFELCANRGVVAHEPTELVVTVRGGTPLAELEELLAEKGQYLAFEPPHCGGGERNTQPPHFSPLPGRWAGGEGYSPSPPHPVYAPGRAG